MRDRIRNAKNTRLRNLSLRSFADNRIRCRIIALASEITTWVGLLAHPDRPARRWERPSACDTACSRSRRPWPATRAVHLSDCSAWAGAVEAGHARLCALPVPAG